MAPAANTLVSATEVTCVQRAFGLGCNAELRGDDGIHSGEKRGRFTVESERSCVHRSKSLEISGACSVGSMQLY